MKRNVIGICLLVFLAASAASAALYEQPFDEKGGWTSVHKPSDNMVMFDDFTLSSDATVGLVSWTGRRLGGPLTGFTISIWSDNDVHPFPPQLYTTTLSGSANETFLKHLGPNWDVYSYSCSLPVGFAAAAGTTYWLSIAAIGPETLDTWQWGSASGGNGVSYQDVNGYMWKRTPDTYGLSPDLAFTLNASPVPEPSTCITGALLLLLLGAQGIRSLRNRKSEA